GRLRRCRYGHGRNHSHRGREPRCARLDHPEVSSRRLSVDASIGVRREARARGARACMPYGGSTVAGARVRSQLFGQENTDFLTTNSVRAKGRTKKRGVQPMTGRPADYFDAVLSRSNGAEVLREDEAL